MTVFLHCAPEMFRAILFQIVATAVAALMAGAFIGKAGAVSALLGALACVLPNFLFALRLASVCRRQKASYPANFFLGEFVKLALTVGLLYLLGTRFADLHWPSMLIGMVLALQAGFLAFWKKS